MDVDLLRAAFSWLKRHAAPGVDGLTWREYETNLEDHPNQITSWKSQLLENAAGIFGPGAGEGTTDRERIKELHEKIGQLTVERDFFETALGRFPGRAHGDDRSKCEAFGE